MSGSATEFIGLILQIFGYLIIARALTSWFPDARRYPIVQLLYQITDPVMVPASRLIPRIGMIDLSPMIVFIVLRVVAAQLRGSAGIF